MKPTLKAHGYKRLELNMMNCFRILLSISTCAATARRVEVTCSFKPALHWVVIMKLLEATLLFFQAGRLLRTITRPTLNLFLLLRASV